MRHDISIFPNLGSLSWRSIGLAADSIDTVAKGFGTKLVMVYRETKKQNNGRASR